MATDDLARFLFEIASSNRLEILLAVMERPLRHAQLAPKLDMSASEATRVLARLSSAGLVIKNAQTAYEPTNLTRLLLSCLPFLRFLTANREFLLSHDILVLPPEFVERLGALSECKFERGMYKVIGSQERNLRAVKRRMWAISKQAFDTVLAIVREKAAQGADVRVIRHRAEFEDERAGPSAVDRNYPVRVLDETRIFLAVLDDTAAVCFPTFGGDVDMGTMIVLEDPRGCRWAEDLFLNYWGMARERL